MCHGGSLGLRRCAALSYLAVGLAGLAVSAAEPAPSAFGDGVAERLRNAGSELVEAAGVAPGGLHETAGEAGASLEFMFVLDEMERLAELAGSSPDSTPEPCAGAPPSLWQLVEPACLAALLRTERREWRLAAELAAQGFEAARAALAGSIPMPLDGEAGESGADAGPLNDWWERHALTGLAAVARVGREWIKDSERDDRDRRARRIARRMERVLREPALLGLHSVLHDASRADVAVLADPLRRLYDDKTETAARLGAAGEVARGYQAALGTAVGEFVARLGAESDKACLDVVPESLRETLQPGASECRGAVGRLAAALEAAGRDRPLEGEVSQALQGALHERSLTLRLLLAKLKGSEEAGTCGDAVAAMAATSTPAPDPLDDQRLARLASRVSGLVELCRPAVEEAFEATASRWVRPLCDGAPEAEGSFGSIGEEAVRPLRARWADFRESLDDHDGAAVCPGAGREGLDAGSAGPGSRALSKPAQRALDEFLGEAGAVLAGQPIGRLRFVLDTVRVRAAEDARIAYLRTLCGLWTGETDAARAASVPGTAFGHLGVGDALAGRMCGVLGNGGRMADMGALAAAMEAAEPSEEAASGAGVSLEGTLRTVAARIQEDGPRIARAIRALGEAAGLATGPGEVIPLGGKEFGCEADGTSRGRGLGAGAKVTFTAVALDTTDPGAWRLLLDGVVGLAICAVADGGDGLRYVVVVEDWSAPLELPLEIGGANAAPNAVAAEWRVKLRKAVHQALRKRQIPVAEIDRALRESMPELLAAAGVDSSARAVMRVAVDRWSAGQGVGYAAAEGLVLRFKIPAPGAGGGAERPDASVCVRIPVFRQQHDAASSCRPATEIGEAALGLAWGLLKPPLRARLQQLGGEMGLEESEAAAMVEGVLKGLEAGGAEGLIEPGRLGVVAARGRPASVRLRLPPESLLTGWERNLPGLGGEVAPLAGDLLLTLRFAEGVAFVDDSKMPAPDPRYLLARALRIPDLEAGALSVSRLTGKGPCTDGAPLRLAMAGHAPLAGVLGVVCLQAADGTVGARLVLDAGGSFASRDGLWTVRLDVHDGCCEIERGQFEVDVMMIPRDGRFAGLEEVWVKALVDLRSGEMKVLPDGDANRLVYGMVQRALATTLPAGVGIGGLRFGAAGLEFTVDGAAPPDAAQRLWHVVGGAVPEGLGSAVAGTGCELQKVGWLARLVDTGEPPPRSLAGCDSDVELVDYAEPLPGMRVAWDCETQAGKSGGMRKCVIGFPKSLTLCDGDLQIDVRWPRRTLTPRGLAQCLQRRVGELVPKSIARRVEVKDGVRLFGNCAETSGCGVGMRLEVAMPSLRGGDGSVTGALPEACLFAKQKLEFTGAVTFAGDVILEPGSGDPFANASRLAGGCAQALGEVAVRVAAGRIARDLSADKVLETLAEVTGTALEEARAALESVGEGAADCELKRDRGDAIDCKDLEARHLREGAISTVRMGKTVRLAGTRFTLGMAAPWSLPDMGSPMDGVPAADAADKGVKQVLTAAAQHWVGELWPSPSLACEGGRPLGECLASVAAAVSGGTGPALGGMVSYPGGASMEREDDLFRFRVPLQVNVPVLDREVHVAVECALDVQDWREPRLAGCSGDADVEAVVAGELVRVLGEQLVDRAVDLGVLKYRVEAVKGRRPDGSRLVIEGVARVLPEDLGELPQLKLSVVFGPDWRPRIEAGLDAFLEALEGGVAESVRESIGSVLPIQITGVSVWEKRNGIPTAFAIATAADIAGLVSVSGPNLVLGADGIRIRGAKRFVISFSDGLTIPVPPFAVCPTGGGIEGSSVVIRANTTVGECSASGVLKHAGEVRFDPSEPGRFEIDGSLTLLGMLPLGSNAGVIDLGVPRVSQEAAIGGVAKDIIAMQGQFTVSGSPLVAEAGTQAALFGVPVGRGDFRLDLETGTLNVSVAANLGFAKGDGHVRTGPRFARPRAQLNTKMEIAGFAAVRGDLAVRPRLVKAGLTVFGMRFGVALPGLEALSESAVAEALASLLTLDVDLDAALEALLSGDATLSPFGAAGSGGDGLGGDEDGDAGASGGDRNGHGDVVAGAPQATEGEVPEGSEVGPVALVAGIEQVWFRRDGDVVRIGTGNPDGRAARLVAAARYDDAHFGTDGKGLGASMSVHAHGYSQVLRRNVSRGGGCEAASADVAYLYTGVEDPRRGYYELCRVQHAGEALSVEALGRLEADARMDLAALNAALVAELGERVVLGGAPEIRVIDEARLLVSETGGLRGAAALQRPGELLVAVRGRMAEGAACGTSATPDLEQQWSVPRIFWLVGGWDLGDGEAVLRAAAALWGCDDGALGRLDPTGQMLATGMVVSGADASGFAQIGRVARAVEPTPAAPNWVESFAAERRAVAELAARAGENVQASKAVADAAKQLAAGATPTLCFERCVAGQVETKGNGDPCVVLVDGEERAQFTRDRLGDDCTPRRGHAWMRGGGSHLTAITAGFGDPERKGLRLGVFGPAASGFAETEMLPLGTGRDGLTMAEYRVANRFLELAAGRGKQMLKSAEVVRGASGAVGLVGAVDGGFQWVVPEGRGTHAFVQTGEALTARQKKALLEARAGLRPHRAQVRDDRLVLWMERVARLYWWSAETESWELGVEIDRIAAAGARGFEEVVLEDLAGRAPARRVGAMIAGRPPQRGLGYAEWGEPSGPGSLWIAQRTVAAADGGRPAPLRLGETRTVRETDEVAVWVDFVVPAGEGSVELFAWNADGESRDQQICLFDADGMLRGNVRGRRAGPMAVVIERGSGDMAMVAAVSVFGGGETLPFQVALRSRPFWYSEPDGGRAVADECQGLQPYRAMGAGGGPVEFEEHGIQGVGLARSNDGFLRGLVHAVDGESGDGVRYEVFRSGGAAQAARFGSDGKSLELLRQVARGKLAVMGTFGSEGKPSDLPPRHAWPSLAGALADGRGDATVLRGSSVTLPGVAGGEGWWVTLPRDVASGARTVFFEQDGPREIRVPPTATPAAMAAAVGYLVSNEVHSIELHGPEALVGLVHPRACPASASACGKLLVRLEGDTGKVLAEARVRGRDAAAVVSKAAVDLFLYEAGGVTGRGGLAFERRSVAGGAVGLMRFEASAPFRVVLEAGWAGCLSVEGVDVGEPGLEDLLEAWPVRPARRDPWHLGDCGPGSVGHWQLSGGPGVAPGTGAAGPRRPLILHAMGPSGALRLMAVAGRADPGGLRVVEVDDFPAEMKSFVVGQLVRRLGEGETIVAAGSCSAKEGGGGRGSVTLEIAAAGAGAPGGGQNTRLLAFYGGSGGHCTLSGLRVARPPETLVGDVLRDTHARLCEGVEQVVRGAEGCLPARARELSLLQSGETWQVWERSPGTRSAGPP